MIFGLTVTTIVAISSATVIIFGGAYLLIRVLSKPIEAQESLIDNK